MPLPRRVEQVDASATHVAPAAFQQPARYAAPPPPAYPPAPQSAPPPARAARPSRWATLRTCLTRIFVLTGFTLVAAGLLFGTFALYEYYKIRQTLPSVDDLRNRASQFETGTILDRNGEVLYEIIDPNAGRRTYVPLEEISPYLIAATVATEDKAYFSHPGFDPLAILRAFYQNIREGETVSGASTITQQLARNLLFDPDERYDRSYLRKVREALLANEINRVYTKEEVLELYLNEIYYGNLAYGIEAASQTYFGIPASQLDMGQAAFLAGLPQAPAVYDIYTNPEDVMGRLQVVLGLMLETSLEQNCIFVGVTRSSICVDRDIALDAFTDILGYDFQPPDYQVRYPHWVTFVRSELETLVDAQTLYRSGFIIHTTIDPNLQDAAEEIVARQVASLADRNATNGALVAIDPRTGEILAMVGSADFYNEDIDGQVNMALAPRQPGSSIKPLTYLAAFEKGWTPATLLWDIPYEFPPSGDPNDPRDPYKPVNYDGAFHGPVTVRAALANSYNIPAVHTLAFVGIYDNPDTPERDGLIGMAERLGITTLNRADFGLALTLGGGEVPLMEMTGAYAVFANGGRRIPPVAITKIEDRNGNVIFEYNPPAGDQVIRAEHAYLLSSIMSDNAARTPAFGSNSVLNLPFPTAAKTGTTNDFRDNWTLGYTNHLAVGVWVGNADYSPMLNSSGLTGAAPIFAEFMMTAVNLSGSSPGQFPRPAGIAEIVICAVSGTEPSQWCPSQRTEIFAADQPPLPKSEDLWKRVTVDTWTGLTASNACNEFTEERLLINITDIVVKDWIRDTQQGRGWAEGVGFEDPFRFVPKRECDEEDPQPTILIAFPIAGSTITTSTVEILARVDAPNGIEEFTVDWGEGEDPADWKQIDKSKQTSGEPVKVGTWQIDPFFPPGTVSLRIYVKGPDEGFAELIIRLVLNIPTPTPTPTPTETPTETPTPTPTATPPLPTATPSPTSGLPPTVTPSATLPPPTP
jgi:membrane peptidoglycan carboxypeptidase